MKNLLTKTVATPRRLIVSMAVVAAVVGAALAGVLVPRSADAAGTTVAAVSLAAPATGTYGTKINLTGVLWKYNTSTKIAGAQVVLQRANHGKANWGNLNYAKTSATGAFSFAVTQQGAYDYRAYYAGSAVYRAALSAVKYPVVTQGVTFSSIATINQLTGALTATGKVTPTPPNGTPVYLEYLSGQKWVSFASGTTTAGAVKVTGNRPGSVANYRLRVAARGGFGAGVSAAKSFSNYVWRGGFARGFATETGGFTLAAGDASKSTGAFLISTFGEVDVPTTGCTKVSYKAQRMDTTGPGTVFANLGTMNGEHFYTGAQLSTSTSMSHNWGGDLLASFPRVRPTFRASEGATTVNAQLVLKLLCAN